MRYLKRLGQRWWLGGFVAATGCDAPVAPSTSKSDSATVVISREVIPSELASATRDVSAESAFESATESVILSADELRDGGVLVPIGDREPQRRLERLPPVTDVTPFVSSAALQSPIPDYPRTATP